MRIIRIQNALTQLNKYFVQLTANAAMISLAAANLKPPMREKPQLITWARKQIHLMLGDAGRSYVVGYGKNPPVRPHHRSR